MYLHLLTHMGDTISVLNTRQPLTATDRADLVYSLQVYDGVGVLSSHSNLDRLPRFIDSGQIKKEDVPIQLRGEELFAYLEAMVNKPAPKPQPGNLKPWTRSSCPIKVSSNPATAEQMTWAKDLLGQGLSWRKTAKKVGVPAGSLQKLLKAA